MRADRLVATVLLLQQRGRVTAADLAVELEVSVPTARRDLEALSSSGVPVYPQPGRGGGWQLVGGARTDLSGLSAAEAQALFLLLGPSAGGSPETRAALRKLLRALPATFRDEAEAAAGTTLVDRAGWGGVERERPVLVDTLQAAVVRRRRVRLTYADARGRTSERLVEPWGVVDKDETWYVVAGTDRGRRTFRVDRVVDAEVTAETFERPSDLVLDEAWRETVGAMEERRSRTSATVLVDERFVFVLRDHFGRHCSVVGSEPDGRARVEVAAPTALDLARTLAGWGGRLEVVRPASVRAELARIGSELVASYG
ncbi:YafY family protein [Nocardioides sp.]|uniref:helix-turn-helix transcriptional regulator n=1 Tax=Nocardioides sp. TaxID=35761 RepID=UPI00272236A3|nr:WYL domain-containing protein [Nocardioides sp.]MDO9454552.1 WYL domain-containing protein [Nocardioides sp.]